MKNHTQILAYCSDRELSELATRVLQNYSEGEIKLLKGPSQGLVMLRQQESVADSQFNAGEILVTEVRLELNNLFGFGMVIGDRPMAALAIAIVDAALTQQGSLAEELTRSIQVLGQAVEQGRRKDYRQVANTRVAFEVF